MSRTINTLFMLMSLDGKISTGDNDSLDTDGDLRSVDIVKDGIHQYYEIEQTTDLCSFNTGRVMAKKCKSLDMNNRTDTPKKMGVDFVIVDNSHLNSNGVKYLCQKVRKLFLVTKNPNHPALNLSFENVEVIKYQEKVDFHDVFAKLKNDFGIPKVTIQSGGTVNAILIREGLIDYVNIVIAPCLIGGKDTATGVDGESLHDIKELSKINTLQIIDCKKLENSYIQILYKVV